MEFTVVADVMEETDISDPTICTGDLLNLAPPPETSPEGSLLLELKPGIHESYRQNDVQDILTAIRSIKSDPAVLEAAKRRYRQLFANVDELYYVMGNQDIPEALTAVAAEYDHVDHASGLPSVVGVDGLIPEVAGTPPETFPCECSTEHFRKTVRRATGNVLIAHTIPDSFDPDEYGFSVAICSTDQDESLDTGEGVIRLPPKPTTDIVARLVLDDVASNRDAQVTLTTGQDRDRDSHGPRYLQSSDEHHKDDR